MALTANERWARHQRRKREGVVACVLVDVDQIVLDQLQSCGRVAEDYTAAELGEAIRAFNLGLALTLAASCQAR